MSRDLDLLLPVTGMTCANCAATVERTLKKKVPGVTMAAVNFATETASVSYIPDQTTRRDMIDAVERAIGQLVLPEGAVPQVSSFDFSTSSRLPESKRIRRLPQPTMCVSRISIAVTSSYSCS